MLGSERLTGATLDRLTHRCRIIETKGERFRLQDAKARTSRRTKSPETVDETAASCSLQTTNGTNYFDVATSTNSAFAEVMIEDCVHVTSDTSLDWFTGAYYESVVADPAFPITDSGGCLSFTVDSSSTPSLSQLNGTVFANVQVSSVACAVISGNVHSTVSFKKSVPFSKEDKTGFTSGLTLLDGGTITWSKSHPTTVYSGALSPASFDACPKKGSSEYDFSGEVTVAAAPTRSSAIR